MSVATRTELRKISIPLDINQDDRPASIAIGNNGRALITTEACCTSGFNGYVMQLVLATDVATRRTDYSTLNGLTSRGRLTPSGDRSRIVVIETGISGGDTTVYKSCARW